MKKVFVFVFFIAVVVCFTIPNLSEEYGFSDVTMANIEALARGEGSFFGCDESVIDSYSEKRWDYSGQCYGTTTVISYACSSGFFGGCREGYVQTYYDCRGNVTGRFDNTSSGCGF